MQGMGGGYGMPNLPDFGQGPPLNSRQGVHFLFKITDPQLISIQNDCSPTNFLFKIYYA